MELVWQLVLVGVACLAIGASIGLQFAPSGNKARRAVEELDELRDEFEQYRHDVTHHFSKTGELVNAMTRSYKTVYDHLAAGSGKFGETEIQTTRMHYMQEEIPVLKVDATVDVRSVPVTSRDDIVLSDHDQPLASASMESGKSGGSRKSAEPRDYAVNEKGEGQHLQQQVPH